MHRYDARLLTATLTVLAALACGVPAAETNEAITADTPAMSAAPVTAAQAAERGGETLTVTGRVASTFFMESSDRQPTFLNLDEVYPNQALTVVIFGEERGLFDQPPETLFEAQEISVTGEVKMYRGRAEIVVTEPTAIRILGPAGEPSDESAEGDGEKPPVAPAE